MYLFNQFNQFTLSRIHTSLRALVMLLVLLFVSGDFANAVSAATTHLPDTVARALSQAGISESSIGIFVQTIVANQPILSIGAERSLNPASTMKLVTTFAGLELLGPAFTWNTEVFTDGSIQSETLHGNLYLKGQGDPKLTIEQFWLLLRNLQARGIREIRGDLILDRTAFADERSDSAGFDDQPTRPYNTTPSALMVNFKAVTLQFIPEPLTRSVRIISEPALPAVQISNQIKLIDGACGDWLSRLSVDTPGQADSAQLQFSGVYPLDCGERTRSYSVLGHRQYIGALFTQLWKELGGTFSGQVREATLPNTARAVSTITSPALSEVVRDINKYSNNVMARQLFLSLGLSGSSGSGATAANANLNIRQWLQQRQLPMPELVLENGSGLSRIERISAQHLGQLLLAAYQSSVMPELVASLPVAAVDGTLRKRLKNAGVAGQAHIKTGTLAGVRSIAGYVLDARGNRKVVVFIINHAQAGQAQAAQDALLNWVYSAEDNACCKPVPRRTSKP